MRAIGSPLLLASMVAAIACSSERALAPTSGHQGQSDIPPEMLAPYTLTTLPGTEEVVALNDSGDVVGATATGGVLWHRANHERTTLPIIPTAIANDGTVAGSVDGHAATWRNGRVTILDTAASAALAICRCESATVVGSVRVNGVKHAAIWVDGIRIDAGVPEIADSAEFSAIGTGFVVGNAIVRTPNPQTGGSSDFEQPFSWSPSGGWRHFALSNMAIASIVSLNSHGIGVGFGFCLCNHISGQAIVYDVAAGSGAGDLPNLPFFNDVVPTGVNDSAQVSANAFVNLQGDGTVAEIPVVTSTSFLSGGQVLPPGISGDRTAGINSAGIIGGQSNGLPVLWIPNP